MSLFPQRWRAKYIDRGIGTPVYTYKIVRARNWKEAMEKAAEVRPDLQRLLNVEQAEPLLRLPRFRRMTALGVFLMGVAALSPHWVSRPTPERRVVQFVQVEQPEEDVRWNCHIHGNQRCAPGAGGNYL